VSLPNTHYVIVLGCVALVSLGLGLYLVYRGLRARLILPLASGGVITLLALGGLGFVAALAFVP
jgi:hypothetical protein